MVSPYHAAPLGAPDVIARRPRPCSRVLVPALTPALFDGGRSYVLSIVPIAVPVFSTNGPRTAHPPWHSLSRPAIVSRERAAAHGGSDVRCGLAPSPRAPRSCAYARSYMHPENGLTTVLSVAAMPSHPSQFNSASTPSTTRFSAQTGRTPTTIGATLASGPMVCARTRLDTHVGHFSS